MFLFLFLGYLSWLLEQQEQVWELRVVLGKGGRRACLHSCRLSASHVPRGTTVSPPPHTHHHRQEPKPRQPFAKRETQILRNAQVRDQPGNFAQGYPKPSVLGKCPERHHAQPRQRTPRQQVPVKLSTCSKAPGLAPRVEGRREGSEFHTSQGLDTGPSTPETVP